MRTERLVGWIAHDLKRGGHWGQVAGVVAIVVSLLVPAGMALLWPFDAELALPTEVSGKQVRVSVPLTLMDEGEGSSSLADRIRMSCGRYEGTQMSAMHTITFASKDDLACVDSEQPLAHLRTEFSIWDLARIEMSRSALNTEGY